MSRKPITLNLTKQEAEFLLPAIRRHLKKVTKEAQKSSEAYNPPPGKADLNKVRQEVLTSVLNRLVKAIQEAKEGAEE